MSAFFSTKTKLFLLVVIAAVSVVSTAQSKESGRCYHPGHLDLRSSDGNGSMKVDYDRSLSEITISLTGDLETSNGNWKKLKRLANYLECLAESPEGLSLVRLKTINANGGDVDYHTQLIKGIQRACRPDTARGQRQRCIIQTEMHRKCASACELLHISCQENFTSYRAPGSKLYLHCSYSEINGVNRCDGWRSLKAEFSRHCSSSVAISSNKAAAFWDYVNRMKEQNYYSRIRFSSPSDSELSGLRYLFLFRSPLK